MNVFVSKINLRNILIMPVFKDDGPIRLTNNSIYNKI